MDMEKGEFKQAQMNKIRISGIQVEWHPEQGTCTFEKLPVAMMWVDTTLAGLMSGSPTFRRKLGWLLRENWINDNLTK